MIELRHLRYFLEAAQQLHFARAAERLGIAAPTLTVQIQEIERTLGASLFLRSKRAVVLTAAGAAFRIEAEQALQRFEDAVAAGKRAGKGEAGKLDIGYVGSAALAGTSFPIDRHMTAAALGFDAPCANSLDAVSDRDFALEFLSAASICAMHLSRLAEEIVIWSSAQFRFVALSDRFSTGSSIMPQKKNPDAAELLRAKLGRILGAQVALTVVMKGLPLAYSKDMQEDKEQVFDAADTLLLGLAAMAGMVSDMTADRARLEAAAGAGFSTATDLADYLVRKGVAFRDAHEIVGLSVAYGLKTKKDLSEMSLEELQQFSDTIEQDVFEVLTLECSVAARNHIGGTAPDQVRAAASRAREALAALKRNR